MKVEAFFWSALVAFGAAAPVVGGTLFIVPNFDTSITSNTNALAIEGGINSAISTIEGLYATPYAPSVSIPVTFTYNPGSAGNLESTEQGYYSLPYGEYVSLLQLDSAANPGNSVLAAAIANLSSGNDANGSGDVVVSGALLTMLGDPSAPDATININSNQTFDFSRPVSSGAFDLIGGLEHELDEVLGGGGAGSTLNAIADGACNNGSPLGFFCGTFGPTDLYRYSALNTPSYTTSGSATAYLSINGGLTSFAGVNQSSGGDYGDFAPGGSGAGQFIQNAFNSRGQDEDYTSSSPEFAMLESIGWDASSSAPEPGTLGLLGASLVTLALLRHRRRRN
jgi:hypothetical protein